MVKTSVTQKLHCEHNLVAAKPGNGAALLFVQHDFQCDVFENTLFGSHCVEILDINLF